MNTTIETQPAPVIERSTEQEDVIELTISEVDRQTAGPYTDIHNCIIATALKNRGYNVQFAGVVGAYIGGVSYRFEKEATAWAMRIKIFKLLRNSPHYNWRVVGKVIRLRKGS